MMKTFLYLCGFCFLASLIGANDRPNVLFIAVDDMRAELGCLGSPVVKSPNIDKLAARGMLFERAYCQQAVCNPSRASLLTGLYPWTLRIWDLLTHFRERRPDIVTLPQHFKNNGYQTEGVGKIFHNWRQDDYKGDAVSWSVPEFMHYNTHGADEAKVKGKLPPDEANVPRTEMRDVPDNAYFDGRIAGRAVKTLQRLAKEETPFFLGVGFWKPHAGFNAPKKYWDMYDRSQIGRAANPNPPEGVPEIALHDGREIMRGFKKNPGGRPSPDEEVILRHGYYAAISYVDAQIGKVVDELNRLGLAKNTVIVFWSDHGFHLGENGLWAKTSNFELDARVPMIIVKPGQKSGESTKALVELIDMYPTLVDMCGLPELKHDLEGVSLVPLLNGKMDSVKDAAWTWHPRPAYPPERSDPTVMGYSMRTPAFRYTEWRKVSDGEIVGRELYDHRNDPDETRNVVSAGEKTKEVKDLQQRMRQQMPIGAGLNP
ncbi:MAG: sulfatase [Verrucomicrobiota bacterium]